MHNSSAFCFNFPLVGPDAPPFPAPYAVGDTVWFDLNQDGIPGPSEPAIPGVVLNLLDSSGNMMRKDTTDANGYYIFTVWGPRSVLVWNNVTQQYVPRQIIDGNYTIEVDSVNFLPGGVLYNLNPTTPSPLQSAIVIDTNINTLDFGYFGQPIPVTLKNFDVQFSDNVVYLQWSTESEIHIAGFNILRSTTGQADYQKINSQMVPAKGSATAGASYRYEDKIVDIGPLYYKLTCVHLDGSVDEHGPVVVQTTGVKNSQIETPEIFQLGQNYPNPFNTSTIIPFYINTPTKICADIYDIHGSFVIRLLNVYLSAGQNRVEWDGRNQYGQPVPSGIYFIKVQSDSCTLTRSMVLLK
ncbi:T9SS type A sorting domain-containing protein [candidate division KSB1 bacterium]|nr:T9SS type A sorting domain-containing protein [candidate division KSB1 bacterium]